MKVNFLSVNNCVNRQVRSIFSSIFGKPDEVTKLIKSSGYKGERHEVKSRDGYHLTVHRILPNKRAEYKGTVFLMHGLFRNSADYIATGPQTALPYLLSDHGFDCFLGNARGGKYCKQHDQFEYDSKDFWNFSWEEIGLYDLPAMIEFALDKSRSSKVNYIGHSQGCTTVLTLLSSRPEYNDLISQLHLMAPAIFMDGATSSSYNFLNLMVFKRLSKRLHKFDTTPLLELVNKYAKYKSKKNPDALLKFYKTVTCSAVGKNKGDVQLSPEALESFIHFMSPIVSTMQLQHFIQLYKTGKFQRFDHGEKNEAVYCSSTPPEYDLSKVTVPTYLYHAEHDALVPRRGMDRLAERLPNVKNFEIIPDFNHLDVMLGKDAREFLYYDMLEFLME